MGSDGVPGHRIPPIGLREWRGASRRALLNASPPVVQALLQVVDLEKLSLYFLLVEVIAGLDSTGLEPQQSDVAQGEGRSLSEARALLRPSVAVNPIGRRTVSFRSPGWERRDTVVQRPSDEGPLRPEVNVDSTVLTFGGTHVHVLHRAPAYPG